MDPQKLEAGVLPLMGTDQLCPDPPVKLRGEICNIHPTTPDPQTSKNDPNPNPKHNPQTHKNDPNPNPNPRVKVVYFTRWFYRGLGQTCLSVTTLG